MCDGPNGQAHHRLIRPATGPCLRHPSPAVQPYHHDDDAGRQHQHADRALQGGKPGQEVVGAVPRENSCWIGRHRADSYKPWQWCTAAPPSGRLPGRLSWPPTPSTAAPADITISPASPASGSAVARTGGLIRAQAQNERMLTIKNMLERAHRQPAAALGGCGQPHGQFRGCWCPQPPVRLQNQGRHPQRAPPVSRRRTVGSAHDDTTTRPAKKMWMATRCMRPLWRAPRALRGHVPRSGSSAAACQRNQPRQGPRRDAVQQFTVRGLRVVARGAVAAGRRPKCGGTHGLAARPYGWGFCATGRTPAPSLCRAASGRAASARVVHGATISHPTAGGHHVQHPVPFDAKHLFSGNCPLVSSANTRSGAFRARFTRFTSSAPVPAVHFGGALLGVVKVGPPDERAVAKQPEVLVDSTAPASGPAWQRSRAGCEGGQVSPLRWRCRV